MPSKFIAFGKLTSSGDYHAASLRWVTPRNWDIRIGIFIFVEGGTFDAVLGSPYMATGRHPLIFR